MRPQQPASGAARVRQQSGTVRKYYDRFEFFSTGPNYTLTPRFGGIMMVLLNMRFARESARVDDLIAWFPMALKGPCRCFCGPE